MTHTITRTATHTRVDIQRVFDSVEADIRMAVTRTQLNSGTWACDMAHDLQLFAERGVLTHAHLILCDARGTEIRAIVFTPSTAALGWVDERPRANDWPAPAGGRLHVVVEFTPLMTPASRARVFDGCVFPWAATSIDLAHAGLHVARQQTHRSNGYGVRYEDFR